VALVGFKVLGSQLIGIRRVFQNLGIIETLIDKNVVLGSGFLISVILESHTVSVLDFAFLDVSFTFIDVFF